MAGSQKQLNREDGSDKLVRISLLVDRQDWALMCDRFPGSASMLIRRMIKRFLNDPANDFTLTPEIEPDE